MIKVLAQCSEIVTAQNPLTTIIQNRLDVRVETGYSFSEAAKADDFKEIEPCGAFPTDGDDASVDKL